MNTPELSTPAKICIKLCLSVLAVIWAVIEGAQCARNFLKEELPGIWEDDLR